VAHVVDTSNEQGLTIWERFGFREYNRELAMLSHVLAPRLV
jgi:hypothetical protein